MEFVADRQMEEICLETGVANLGHGPVKIEMRESIGWVVHNGKDIFLNVGEQIELGIAQQPILISSPYQNQRIVFAIETSHSIDTTADAQPVKTQSNLGLKKLAVAVLTSIKS